jgi:hypothetical protein
VAQPPWANVTYLKELCRPAAWMFIRIQREREFTLVSQKNSDLL